VLRYKNRNLLKKRSFPCLALILILLLASAMPVFAKSRDRDDEEDTRLEYKNRDTGYYVLIEDNAELLDEDEREDLLDDMKAVTEYGNAVFLTDTLKSTSNDEQQAHDYSDDYYDDEFGNDNGVMLIIDMGNRLLYVTGHGEAQKLVTSSYARTVTDNIYRYAGDGDYYGCAREAFDEMYRLLDGQRIAQPMKYITSALLAMILAVMVNFILVRAANTAKVPSKDEMLKGLYSQCQLNNPQMILTNTTKVYDPPSSSSGGGGGHGGGGGGHHSSGGGHHF